MGTILTTIWSWMKGHPKTVLGILGALLLLGASMIWREKNRQIQQLSFQVQALEATLKVKDLETKKAVLEQQINTNAEDQVKTEITIASIDEQIFELDKRRVELHLKGQGSTDEEILDAFRKLGY